MGYDHRDLPRLATEITGAPTEPHHRAQRHDYHARFRRWPTNQTETFGAFSATTLTPTTPAGATIAR